MAENTNAGPTALYLIVGALVVVIGLGVFVYAGGYVGARSKTTTEQTTTIPLVGSTTTVTTTTEKPAH